MEHGPIHYLPILTTLVSAVFLYFLAGRAMARGWRPHLAWWAAGVFFYGLGTALEGSITVFGNTIGLTKAWYIAGALLGGYPLAQGTVYLLLSRRAANILTGISLPFIAVAAVLVLVTPSVPEALEAHRPTGDVLGWQWVRLLTPFINLYAAFFLIGGAVLSAWRYLRSGTAQARMWGNLSIAVGAILPGIGGAMAKGGLVEALYVGEFVGILLIWAGYTLCVRQPLSTSADLGEGAGDPAVA